MVNSIDPTDEQQRIIDEEGNIVVIARPGSGKTYTIVQKIKKILEKCYDYNGVIAISYTKKASRELEQRFKVKGICKKSSFFGTIDNFYISEIIIPFTKYLFNRHIDLRVESELKNYPEYAILRKIRNGMDEEKEALLIKSLSEGYIFLEISGETALYILNKIHEARRYIQARYTHIFIDEYQDCGGIQHQIFIRMLSLGLKGIAVGDIDQAIYAFANRHSKYLTELTKNKEFNFYRITKNHRCHKSIEAYSLQLLGIAQPRLHIDTMRVLGVYCTGNEISMAKLIAEHLPLIKKQHAVDNNCKIAILCRNKGSATNISKNIGVENKLFVDNALDVSKYQWSRFFADFLRDYFDENVFPVDVVDQLVDEELDSSSYKRILKMVKELFDLEPYNLIHKIKVFEKLASQIYPEYESCDAMAELGCVLKSQEQLNGYRPPADNEICIMTLHKSKGLEFDVVFHMDLYDWIFPRRDISQEEYQQDLNLHYVGVTRAKKVCYIMQGTERYRPYQGDYWNAKPSPFFTLNGVENYRIDCKW